MGDLPANSLSMAGVTNVEAALKAKLAGADALLLKVEFFDNYLREHPEADLHSLMERLAYMLSGDD